MNSKDVLAKPIVAIRTGRIVGKIRYPIVDAGKHEVIGFIVDDEKWFLETRVILFPLVCGMGKDVITIDDDSAIMPVSNLKAIQGQLEENIQLIGHKVISETGKALGFIEEFSFNDRTGKIESYRIKEKTTCINQHDVISIGRELIVVKENAAVYKDAPKEPWEENFDINSIFERRQMEFILGKRLARNVESETGSSIAHSGEVISEDIIRRAKNQGKFTELVMSIESEMNM
jgi:uncharacterized protein YrrD